MIIVEVELRGDLPCFAFGWAGPLAGESGKGTVIVPSKWDRIHKIDKMLRRSL
jgi:hypothetical protein